MMKRWTLIQASTACHRIIEETWSNWLPKTVAKPFYRDQLTTHVTELKHKVDNLSRELELQSKRPKSRSQQQAATALVSAKFLQ